MSDIDDPSYIRNNGFIEAKKEFNKQENVTVRIDITPKKRRLRLPNKTKRGQARMEQTLLFFARHASPFMTKYLKEVLI